MEMELTGESLERAKKKKTNQNNRGNCRVAPRMERREIMHTRPEKEERKNKKALLLHWILSCRLRVIPHGWMHVVEEGRTETKKRMSQPCLPDWP